jgi:hypothetical protein
MYILMEIRVLEFVVHVFIVPTASCKVDQIPIPFISYDLYVLSRVCVTIDGVRFGYWIY